MAGHILADEIVEHVYAIDVDLIERMDIRRPDTTLVHEPCPGWKPHRSRLTPRRRSVHTPEHPSAPLRIWDQGATATDPREHGTEAPA
jgi:hypothetical protein